MDKSFVVYGDNAMQMFHWLTPYIEEAGYTWKTEPFPNQIGKWQITIDKKL